MGVLQRHSCMTTFDFIEKSGLVGCLQHSMTSAFSRPAGLKFSPAARVTAVTDTKTHVFLFVLGWGPGPSDRPGGGLVNENSMSLRLERSKV